MRLSRFSPVPGSYGARDSNGRFTLKAYTVDKLGAVVGKHKVAVSTIKKAQQQAQQIDPDTGSPDERRGPREREKIPARYNDKTTLIFEVPAGGTDAADFRLTSP